MGESLKLRKQALKPITIVREDYYNIGEESMKKSEEEEEEEPLSPMARVFLKPDSNVHIITILGIKSKIFPDVVKANVLRCALLKHPRFSCLLVVDAKGGDMKWVHTEVDVEKHIIVPELDQGMDSPDKFIEDYILNLSKTTIDMSNPLWDIHLLNLKTSQAEAVAILKFHHSLGDGTSLMSLLLASARKTSDPTALPTIPSMDKKKSEFVTKTHGICYFLRMIWNTVVGVVLFLGTVMFLLRDTQTPLKGPPGVGSTPRRIVQRIVSLDDVKLVKAAMNTTVNDVVVGIVQAGLSRYLNRRYGNIAKKDKGGTATTKENSNNLPNNIRLRAPLFMNIRPSPGIHALAEMMEKGTKAKWGNQIGYVIFPFTIALRDNPLDYVRDAKAVMDRKKASLEALCTFSISKLMLNLFGKKVASFPPHTTMWFSNVIGPQEEISFLGHPVAYIAASCCGQPSALLIHVVSYNNKINFVLSVDEGTVPDPHQLCDDLEVSLMLIKDAVIAGEQNINNFN